MTPQPTNSDALSPLRVVAGAATLHNFRRFFVSHGAEAGVPMATVMAWASHDEMKIVMRYYRVRDDSAQRAIERFAEGLKDDEAPLAPMNDSAPRFRTTRRPFG